MTNDDGPEIFATGALRPADVRRAMLLARIEAAAAPGPAARRRPRILDSTQRVAFDAMQRDRRHYGPRGGTASRRITSRRTGSRSLGP